MPSFLMEHETTIRKLIKEAFERARSMWLSLLQIKAEEGEGQHCLAMEMYNAFALIQQELDLPGSLDIAFFQL